MKYIKARLVDSEYARLEVIKVKYHFKSTYQIMSYLAHCFLRVADKEHDEIDEPLPEEIEEMFDDYSNAESRYTGEKPKRRCNTTIR